MTTMDPIREATEAAKAVWQDLVTVDPPMGLEERLDAVLAAHAAALAAAGCLIVPELAPTEDELDSVAKWMAGKSGFPRYVDNDGWRHLRRHPRDVEVAYAKARDNIGSTGDDQLHALVAARRLLLNATEHAAGSH